ncbi:siphovirus ReqiPepy6 Gp37-like family protein [Sedimentibacter hydroxybenzoicus DSM 7310]|uniref:Siphovirus ReqiPepy6 Gp37-like family protein n=1 Tax=Sedimentibacter hydroxybenzoicus DSM 7310 TaxID=1123245 RepID=A0A974BJL2_SEDHY|nr:siphovirus ReqiPepy6 Gp37-like family protein [Sedimentibacter hydroxybenzoicus]NYB73850.1 siphovirus ReqiPepy6 Gp37-like family protein [Sedimentibacter hydroxybenzoicus DSM 7310]
MELYVFNKELDFQGLVDAFDSFIWRRRYSRCGDFELHLPITAENLNLLRKGNIIHKKDDREAGYIEYRKLTENVEGREVLAVRGRFITGYLGRRIIWGTENLNGTIELAIRNLINNNCISPADTSRKIDLLQLGELKGFTQSANFQVSYSNLLSTIEEKASINELGIRTPIDVQNRRIVFDIYEGLNRTAGQSDNPRAIFSKEFENVLEQEYTDSINDYKNIALIAGEGEGTERVLTTVGSGIGVDRFELFVDARDLQQGEMSTEDYTSQLQQRGNEKLSENSIIQTFNSKVNVLSNLTYKVNFDLGDIVTCVSKKWGITINTRITEIEEVYESDGFKINITFGNDIPTLIEKIKKVIR